jgi:hypothetical protein
VVKEGDTVPLKIVLIETDRRRIGLSLRQAREELGEGEEELYRSSSGGRRGGGYSNSEYTYTTGDDDDEDDRRYK